MLAVTYNLRYQDDENGNSIDERAPRLKQILSAYNADLIGFQEVTPRWLWHIEEDYGGEYEIFSRYRDEVSREAVPILWKKERFCCIERGCFWLSDTPDEESAGYDESGCYRICMWVKLREVESGRIFAYFNTHFGFGEAEQAASVRLLKDRIQAAAVPSVLTGDFNLNRKSRGYRELTCFLTDVNAATDNDLRGTWQNYERENADPQNQIDFCFITEGLSPCGSRRMDELVDGCFASDHYGVCARIEWPGDWGTAASCGERDYVHRVLSGLQAKGLAAGALHVSPARDLFRPAGRCAFRGLTDWTIRFIEEFQLTDAALWRRFVEQFRTEADTKDRGWRGEYWGKMMRGACFIYSYTQNESLYEILTGTVRDMLESMDGEGRISTYAREAEFSGWDIWNRKYVLLGMQYFLEICRESDGEGNLAGRVLDSMCRQADYLIARIGPQEEGKIPVTKASEHWRGLNSSSILEPVMRLYRLTGEEKYLAFADEIVAAGGTSVADIFALACEDRLLPYQYPMTKAYEMISCFEGLLEYWRVRQIPWHREAVLRFADRVLESDFTVIGSSGCTHELFDHSTVRQANTTNGELMQETCVTVTLMKFFWELTMLTGNAVYADAFERSYYNAYLGAVNTKKRVSPLLTELYPEAVEEPVPFDSYSPLTAGVRGRGIGGLKLMADNHYYGCCACIGAAGAGLVPKMALMKSADGLAVNLYIPGEMETTGPEGSLVRLRVTTEYPKEGQVRIFVETEAEEPFVVRLRNPAWSRETRASVDRMPVVPAAKGRAEAEEREEEISKTAVMRDGYLSFYQSWQGSHEILLWLDMRTEALRPVPYGHDILMNQVIWEENYMVSSYDEEDPQAKRHICLRRGPLVLAASGELGYDASGVFDIEVEEDGTVPARRPERERAPYPHMAELEIPLRGGGSFTVTDYASAGKGWDERGTIAAWICTG